MKRAAALVVCLFLLSCLTGCMTDFGDKTESVEQSGEGSLGSYYVKITDHFVASTATGKDVLILSFDFTNNGHSGVSAASALGLTLFQSGIELSPATLLFPPAGYDSANYHKKVKDGATLNCQAAFYLRSCTDPVEVEIAHSFSFGMEKVTAKLDIDTVSQPNL